MSNVIVLGCGPSGLVAAYTAAQLGHYVRIYSRAIKSPVHGAQFLHAPIFKEEVGEWVKWQHMHPNREQYDPTHYLRKVYGPAWDGTISPEMYNEGQRAWDLRATYDMLWDMYKPLIDEWEYSPANLMNLHNRPDTFLVNTLPRRIVCIRPGTHNFLSTAIWAHGETDFQPPAILHEDMTITYNGEYQPTWYRASRIFGRTTVEWPGHMLKPPVQGVVQVAKPLRTNCTCWHSVGHVGRYGLWQKGVLLHHVPAQVAEFLNQAKQEALF